jgi:hypothetical protein
MPDFFTKKNGEISVYKKKSLKPVGRPSRFTKDLQDHAVSLSQIGLKNVDIARALDLPWSTFGMWLKKFREFATRLDENRNLMLKNAEKALALRINGYTFKETKVTKQQVLKKNENGELIPTGGIKVKTETIETHMPPDVKAATYVLDRRSKYYRKQPDAIEEDITGESFNVIVKEIKSPEDK